MSDVEMVIKIPEELKNKIDSANDDNYRTYIWWFETTLYRAIKEGAILPKGHGRLKDIDWIDDNCPYYYSDEDARLCYSVNDVNEAPTVIDADTERGKQ